MSTTPWRPLVGTLRIVADYTMVNHSVYNITNTQQKPRTHVRGFVLQGRQGTTPAA